MLQASDTENRSHTANAIKII